MMKPFGYPSNRLTILWRELLVIALAAVGGGAFALLGMPAAWLSGSALLSVVVALLRPLPSLRLPWFDATMVLSGVILGSAATPEALAAAARYPASLLVLFVAIVAIMLASGAYLRYAARWPWLDALLATAPGALGTALALAQAKGADFGRISFIQMFRLLVLVALLPSVMQLSGATGLEAPVVEPVDAGTMFGVAMAGLALGLVFQRLGLSAPLMLGATFASAALHAGGVVEGPLPMQIQIAVQVLLGATMGGRIAYIPRKELKRLFPLAIGSFAVSIAVAFLFAWPAAWLAGVSYASGMAAFAPGGLEAMAMLAFAMGLDTLYVGAHHLVRFVVIGLAMPLVLGRMRRQLPR
jgi:membrane AbrB-like protein